MKLREVISTNLYKLHRYAGLFVAVHFVIFAITGLLLLFRDELTASNSVAPEVVSLSEEQIAENYSTILHHIKVTYPRHLPLALFPEDDSPQNIHARLGAEGSTKLRGALRTQFNLNNGSEFLGNQNKDTDVFDTLLVLHRELFLGSNGKLYVGFVGLVYVFLLVSGFLIYGKFMKGRGFGELRNSRVPRLVDLHKFTGAATFGWSLLVGVSGMFLAFNGVLIKTFQYQSLKHLSTQFENYEIKTSLAAPFSKVIASALNAKPDSVVSYVSFPNTEFGIPGHYLVLLQGKTPITERLAELAVVNAADGTLTQILQLPWYLKLVLLSEPLHFGDYGGLPLKIIWCLFTVGSLAVACFGITSFYLKSTRFKPKLRTENRRVVFGLHSSPTYASLSRQSYTIPAVLSALCIAGMVASLFSTGFVNSIAVTFIFLPIAILMIGRKNV